MTTDRKRGVLRRLILTGPTGKTFLDRRGLDFKLFGIYLHRIADADPGIDLHDHPWPFVSIILWGGYIEEVADARDAPGYAKLAEEFPQSFTHGVEQVWRAGSIHRLRLTECHRITHVDPHTWTLVLRGRRVRSWGFYQPDGFVDQRVYDYVVRRPVKAAYR